MTTFYVISLKLFKYKITDVVTDMKITCLLYTSNPEGSEKRDR